MMKGSIIYFLGGAMLTLILVSTFIFVILFVNISKYEKKVYPSIYIDNQIQTGRYLGDMQKNFDRIDNKLAGIQLEINFQDKPVATLSGKMLNLKTNGSDIAKDAYSVARSGNTLVRFVDLFHSIFGTKKFYFYSTVNYSLEPMSDAIAILEKQYNIAPQNALFEIKDGKVVAFVADKNGLAVDRQEALIKLGNEMRSIYKGSNSVPSKITVIVNTKILSPEVRVSQANDLGISEIIGVGTSNYSGSIPERIHNLILATKRIDGTIVKSGDEFSFNKTVGEISSHTGYKPAYVIINGRTVLGDGGGVCQTSTTIFRSAIASGLQITEWHPHAYRVHYYENDGKPGRDATVYAPSVDFRFKNDTDSAILIDTDYDEDNLTLTYTLWGKKDDRKIQISDVQTGAHIPAPPDREQEDPTLKRGMRRQVDWSASGLTTWFDYKVIKSDKTIYEKRFTSNFRPWQAVFLVGTAD
jgi:vancomycin resistance protein YoaR